MIAAALVAASAVGFGLLPPTRSPTQPTIPGQQTFAIEEGFTLTNYDGSDSVFEPGSCVSNGDSLYVDRPREIPAEVCNDCIVPPLPTYVPECATGPRGTFTITDSPDITLSSAGVYAQHQINLLIHYADYRGRGSANNGSLPYSSVFNNNNGVGRSEVLTLCSQMAHFMAANGNIIYYGVGLNRQYHWECRVLSESSYDALVYTYDVFKTGAYGSTPFYLEMYASGTVSPTMAPTVAPTQSPTQFTTTTATTTTISTTTTTSTKTWAAYIAKRILVSGGIHEPKSVPSLVVYELVGWPYKLVPAPHQLGEARIRHSMVSYYSHVNDRIETCYIGGVNHMTGARPPIECEEEFEHTLIENVPQPAGGAHNVNGGTAVVANNAIAMSGGHNGSGTATPALSYGTVSGVFETVYSSAFAVVDGAMAGSDDYIYLSGGYTLETNSTASHQLLLVAVADVSAPPTQRALPAYASAGVWGHAMAANGAELYMVGGCVGADRASCTVTDQGAFSTDGGSTWSAIQMSNPRVGCAAILHDDGVLWILGGTDTTGAIVETLEILDTDDRTATKPERRVTFEFGGGAFDLLDFAATLRPVNLDLTSTTETRTTTTRTTTTSSTTSTTTTSSSTTVPPYGRVHVSAAGSAVLADDDMMLHAEAISDNRSGHSMIYHRTYLCAVGGLLPNGSLATPVLCARAVDPESVETTATALVWTTAWWGDLGPIPPMPAPVHSGSAAVLRGTLVVVGGVDGSNTTIGGAQCLFEGRNESRWGPCGANLPPRAHGAAVAATDGYLYQFGGLDNHGAVTTDVYMLSDPASLLGFERLGGGTSVPEVYGFAAAEVGAVVYIVGGIDRDGRCSSSAQMMDLRNTSTIVPLPLLPAPLCYAVASSLGDALVVAGHGNNVTALTPAASHSVNVAPYNSTAEWTTVNWTAPVFGTERMAAVVVTNKPVVTTTTMTSSGGESENTRRPEWDPTTAEPEAHKLDGPEGAIGLGAAATVAFGILAVISRL